MEKKRNILLISSYDEWYGPIYICPFCAKETLMDNFNFCPACGGNVKGYSFESITEQLKSL